MIYLSRVGLRVRFDKNGEYNTDDERAIRALSQHRSVVLVDDKPALIQSKDEPAPKPVDLEPDYIIEAEEESEPIDKSEYTRAELDELARDAGVEHPEDLPNKDAVVAAIDEARD